MRILLTLIVLIVAFFPATVLAQDGNVLDPGFWENVFGIDGATAGAIVAVFGLLRIVSKLIPDSQTGIFGLLRKLSRIIGLNPRDNHE